MSYQQTVMRVHPKTNCNDSSWESGSRLKGCRTHASFRKLMHSRGQMLQNLAGQQGPQERCGLNDDEKAGGSCNGQEWVCTTRQNVMTNLGNLPEHKPCGYHSLCTITGQMLTILWVCKNASTKTNPTYHHRGEHPQKQRDESTKGKEGAEVGKRLACWKCRIHTLLGYNLDRAGQKKHYRRIFCH